MEAKPRLLLLTPDFPPASGGIQLLMHRLAVTMSRLSPIVLAPGAERAAEFDRTGTLPVHRVTLRTGGHRAAIAQLNVAAVALAERLKPDVVLSGHIVASPAASVIRKRLGIPVVQYLHANEVGARPRLAAFATSQADAVIAVSEHTCDLARRAGARPEALHRIPPGVDLPERRPEARCSRPTIITVARLEDRYKGHDMMIRALPLVQARVPDVQWIVVGTGPLRPRLEQLADIYGVSSTVRFLGQVTNEARDSWLERSHVFAMPSRLPGDGLGGEGFGIVYTEASWRELPVVAGNRGGAVDAVVDGGTGLLVDADDSIAVAGALTRLLLDPALRRELGARGAERAHQFGWASITPRVEDVALSVIARRRSSAARL